MNTSAATAGLRRDSASTAFGPLQCQQRTFGHGHHLAAVADVGLQVLHVGVLAAGVHHQEDVAEGGARGCVGAHHHQVVEQAAAGVGEKRVALLADAQVDHVHRHQAFQRGGGVGAHQAHLAHVRDIEQRRRLAALLVLGHQAAGVLHRHGIAGKGHHAGAQALVQRVQGGLEQGAAQRAAPRRDRGASRSRRVRGIHQKLLDGLAR